MSYYFNITILLFCVTILVSCSFESDDLILDETAGHNFNLYDQYEDGYGNLGVVVYVSKKTSSISNKYIIVISADESKQKWSETNSAVVRADSIGLTEIHDHQFGIGVLQLMQSTGIEEFPAQNWCNLKNHTDVYAGSWHLPTHYELKTLLLNKVDDVNYTLQKIGGDLIDENALYWTCVEDYPGCDILSSTSENKTTYSPENRAIPITPKYKTHPDKDRWLKTNEYRVRAIKFVYYGK